MKFKCTNSYSVKGVAGKDSKEEQHQLKELKGVAVKDSKGEQHQLKELEGVAVVFCKSLFSEIEITL